MKKVIAGPGVYICDECIELCNAILDSEAVGAPVVLEPLDPTVEQAIERMVDLHASRQQVDGAVATAVRDLRGRGVTWARIGDALGMTRQSAWERYSGEE